jgi:uncharacterized membrane protein YjfL (UPF0719 family)
MPPLPISTGFDAGRLALNMLLAIVWALVASVGFAGSIAIGLKVFSALTPGLNEWEELRKGNSSVSILWSAFVLAVAVVVVGVLIK